MKRPLTRRLCMHSTLILSGLAIFNLILTGAQAKASKESPISISPEPVATYTNESPGWLDRPTAPDAAAIYFVGHSDRADSDGNSREQAMMDAKKNAVLYRGVSITDVFKEVATAEGRASGILDPSIRTESRTKQRSGAFLAGIMAVDWYTEKFAKQSGKKTVGYVWQSHVLVSLPRSEIEEAREKNKELRGKTVAGIWDASHEGSVFIVDDGVEPAERYESLKSSLIRFMGENKIAVIERRESLEVDTGLPVLGVKASFARNNDVHGLVSVAGEFVVSLYVTTQDGHRISAGGVKARLSGVGNSVDGAINSAISKFVNQKGKEVLRLFKQDD